MPSTSRRAHPLSEVVMGAVIATWWWALSGPGQERRDRERGDVPGWVLITLMTAGLVTMLWALAGQQLTAVFTRAINSVVGAP